MKDSNDQTSGWAALKAFPGNLFIIIPAIFFGWIGWDYYHSKWDGDAFDPLWMRALAVAIFVGLFIGWLIGVIASEKKKQ